MEKEVLEVLKEIRDDIKEMKIDVTRELREVKIKVSEVFKWSSKTNQAYSQKSLITKEKYTHYNPEKK